MIVTKIIDENIRSIDPSAVVIYKDKNKYFVTSKDVFVLFGLCRFRFYRISNTFEIEISKRYLNYSIKQLQIANISYIIVDKINQYHLIKKEKFQNNKYQYYYLKGRRLYKRRKQINKLLKNISMNLKEEEKIKEIYYLLEGECHEII